MSGAWPSDVDDLERRGLLALDADRVDGVDQRDRREVGDDLAGHLQAVVEVAVDLNDLGAVHDSLRQLAHRDLALRDQHRAGDAGAGGVRRGRRRGVAGRRAQHRLLTAGHRVGDGHRHAAVLERAGRVEALDLQMHRAADLFGQPRRRNQRRAALEQGDRRPVVADRQPVPVRLDQARPLPMDSRLATSSFVGSFQPQHAGHALHHIQFGQCGDGFRQRGIGRACA